MKIEDNMHIWSIRRYFGQWVFFSVAVMLVTIAFTQQQPPQSITGLPVSWYLYLCALACLAHGLLPSIGTWRIVVVIFIIFCLVSGIDALHEKIAIQRKFNEFRPWEIVKSLAILAVFFATGLLSLLSFRRAMPGSMAQQPPPKKP